MVEVGYFIKYTNSEKQKKKERKKESINAFHLLQSIHMSAQLDVCD